MPDRRRPWIIAGASVAVLAVAAAAWLALSPLVPAVTTEEALPAPTWAAPAAPPVTAAAPSAPGIASLADPVWLSQTAESTGIPERALAAYAGVAIDKALQMPTCGLSWNTLAAIGYAESRHGTHAGSSVQADGTVSPGIFGIALDGASTAHIPDSDQGAIDGDAEYDRAVGPMQLIPQTWNNWHVDANADGAGDPQNIDDATMASANYLCRASGDMASEDGWSAGITAYNSDPDYIVTIAEAGSRYRSEAE
ncbi:membrane-bound lytic murein transglycosylase B [Conyzicola lurida]|uniref:Membrane-bound lytic murein transglycosylase B n=1 Tax=Conyzicola lurida TaxID=1172621 RepID=A0A841AS23_9MICO|nr:lytic transglycosylase domain-containing protein [Conyzicola lurida]MBB5844581.1 membrane-bound lytic murein transglycosylase B [Conyzicola lurida]